MFEHVSRISLQFDIENDSPIGVTYEHASLAQLAALVDRSTYCFQEITYDCQNAPLNDDTGV